MSARIRGNSSIRRLSPRFRVTSESSQIIVPFSGLYLALKAAQPAINATLPGLPSDHFVKEVSLEEGKSVEGRMVVTLEKPTPDNTGSQDPSPLGDPIYECDWGEQRRPIEENPRCPQLKSDRLVYEFPDKNFDTATNPGWSSTAAAPEGKTGRQRTWDDWAAMDAGDVTGGTWTIDEYKQLRRLGVNDFAMPFPIARTTLYAKYRVAPNGSVNSISTPPSQCGAPSGFTYVKTASRSSKQGRLYTLVEEWRGYPGTNWGLLFE